MKKTVCLAFIVFIISLFMISGCSKQSETQDSSQEPNVKVEQPATSSQSLDKNTSEQSKSLETASGEAETERNNLDDQNKVELESNQKGTVALKKEEKEVDKEVKPDKEDGNIQQEQTGSTKIETPSGEEVAPEEKPENSENAKTASSATEKTPFEQYLETLPGKFNPDNAQGVSCVYQFNITDGHPGLYWVKIHEGKCTVGKGAVTNPDITINVGEQLWLDIRSDKVNGTMAFLTKKFTATGNTDYLSNMKKYFSK